MTKSLMETIYKLDHSLDSLGVDRRNAKVLENKLVEEGFTKERVIEIGNFLDETVNPHEYEEFVSELSFDNYIKSLKEIQAYMEMAKGYQEMGDINLNIAQESFGLESEAQAIMDEALEYNGESLKQSV